MSKTTRKIAEGVIGFFIILGLGTLIFSAALAVVLAIISFIVWQQFALVVYFAAFRVAAVAAIILAAVAAGKFVSDNN